MARPMVVTSGFSHKCAGRQGGRYRRQDRMRIEVALKWARQGSGRRESGRRERRESVRTEA